MVRRRAAGGWRVICVHIIIITTHWRRTTMVVTKGAKEGKRGKGRGGVAVEEVEQKEGEWMEENMMMESDSARIGYTI